MALGHGIPAPTMAKRFKAAVIGGSGYGGAEMARRLLMHPDVELVRVASIDYVGEPLGAAHPNLEGVTDLRFEDLAPAEAAKGWTSCCSRLPHKVSAAKVPELIAAGVKIVDLSGDFRLRDAAAYKKYYGAKHPHPELLGTFVYGLPELNREEIKQAKYVASPGCFATTIELALLPLARAGLLDGASVEVAGHHRLVGHRHRAERGHAPPGARGNLQTYKPLEHQHVPEIVQTLGDARREGRRAPLRSGLRAALARHLRDVLRRAARHGRQRRGSPRCTTRRYASEPFVRLPKQAPARGRRGRAARTTRGRLRRPARSHERQAHGRAVLARLDNLIKGGAGQAIQSMNIMLGLDERASLEDPGTGRELVVVKIGGEVVGSGEAAVLAADLRTLARAARAIVIVHGGGPQATELQKRLGIETQQVAGRRVTDAATLEVMKMVVAGKVNVDLCAALVAAGAQAGRPARRVRARRARDAPPAEGRRGRRPDPVDFGFVGDVIGVNLALLARCGRAGYVPVLACLGADAEGGVYNINADMVANQLAAALDAERLFLVTRRRACCATSTIRRRASAS